jgi:hypothetical protein
MKPNPMLGEVREPTDRCQACGGDLADAEAYVCRFHWRCAFDRAREMTRDAGPAETSNAFDPYNP